MVAVLFSAALGAFGDLLHTTDGGVSQYAGGANFRFVLENCGPALGSACGYEGHNEIMISVECEYKTHTQSNFFKISKLTLKR